MITVAIVNSKGGVGKTTVSALLSAVWSMTGSSVGCVDMDTYQLSLSDWIEDCGLNVESFEVGKSYDIQLIDTPPRIESQELEEALQVADVVLLVTSSSTPDLRAAIKASQLMEELSPKGVKRVLFNNVKTRSVLDRDLNEIAEAIGIPSLQAQLSHKTCYRRFFDDGWKILTTEAKGEILNLLEEIETIIQTNES